MNQEEIVKHKLRQILDKLTSHTNMEKAARFAIGLINKRVAAGQDLSGNPFAEYSAGYLRLKMGLVRMGKGASGYRKRVFGKWSGKVDLQVTGAMMRDLNSNITRNTVMSLYELEIGYIAGKADSASIDKARWHNKTGAGKGRKLRKFVGLTDDERKQVWNWFNRNKA
jgi:hypothetical protein